MTNVAISRRTDFGGAVVPKSVDEVAAATAERRDTQSTGSTALKAIAAYIPTEVIGLYLAALAAVRAGENTLGAVASAAELTTFYVFIIGTPVFVWLVYAGKAKTGGAKLPLSPGQWPIWEMFASAVSFSAWAYALPESPFTRFSWYTTALGTFVVLVASTVLGLLAPIFQKEITIPASSAAPD